MFPPNSPLSRKFIARRRQSGFSLVEVVLAVGVISFAFVAIMGLIPAGLQQFRQAMDNSVCSQIAQRIIQDAQLTDFDTLTDAAHPVGDAAHPYNYANSYAASDVGRTNPIHVRYFDEQGNEIVPQAASPSNAELASVVYFVNTRISVSTNLPGITTDHSSSNAGLATVLVQVAFNPSGKKIQMDDTNKVFDPTYTKNMPV
ncbi:MAG: Verru_Chthon cassette protein B, partial [Chthoniobacter sp.]|uniref:Verru_Chthon cassette protein B n=1 Tax=Chthoniobacter sp. TaxID=2510640 RepID=UPI0032A3536C